VGFGWRAAQAIQPAIPAVGSALLPKGWDSVYRWASDFLELMRMPLKVLAGAAAIVALVVGAFLFWPGTLGSSTETVVAVAPALKNPLGDAPDKNDPGEQNYKKGLYSEAIAYWTEQADKGDVKAAHRLGVEYMDGKREVVARDFAKALKYHLLAAKAGNAMSMFDVGSIHEYGYGVPKDIKQAAIWYGHSADYGLAQGQYNYGTMLEAGEGVVKDEVEAYKFFILAGRGGFTGVPYNNQTLRIDRNAPLPTELLERKLSKDQLAEGRQRADDFKVASGPLAGE
jgi:Sel1 repeat